jgi:hypothetical protein
MRNALRSERKIRRGDVATSPNPEILIHFILIAPFSHSQSSSNSPRTPFPELLSANPLRRNFARFRSQLFDSSRNHETNHSLAPELPHLRYSTSLVSSSGFPSSRSNLQCSQKHDSLISPRCRASTASPSSFHSLQKFSVLNDDSRIRASMTPRDAASARRRDSDAAVTRLLAPGSMARSWNL